MSGTAHVVVVGPNPAMDILLDVPAFAAGVSRRARGALHLAGGKPMNVARGLRRLGIDVTLASPLGGDLGPARLIGEACASLGIDLRPSPIAQETRTCVVVVDTDTGESTVVNEVGPDLSPNEAEAYVGLVADLPRPGDLVVASGSLPPGLPVDFYADLIDHARVTGARTVVDTSGEPLRAALENGPWAVKVNRDELLAVMPAASVEEAVRRLARTATHVVVTLGAAGSLYAGPDGLYRVTAAPVAAINPTGAGDAFLAGLAAGLARDEAWPQALALAGAAAALVSRRFGPDIGPHAGVADMARQIEVREDRTRTDRWR